MFPRYSTRSCEKKCFQSFGVRPPYLSNVRTAFKWYMWSLIVCEKPMMSSKYPIANFHITELIKIPILRWNIPGAYAWPKGILSKRKSHDAIRKQSFPGPLCQTHYASNRHCSPASWIFSLLRDCPCTCPFSVSGVRLGSWSRLVCGSLHKIVSCRLFSERARLRIFTNSMRTRLLLPGAS